MTHQHCGYRGLGHYCGSQPVQFISRYRDESDYCVNGVRITLYDDGRVHSVCHEPTQAERSAIALKLLEDYAMYCLWRGQNTWIDRPLQPFEGDVYRALLAQEVLC